VPQVFIFRRLALTALRYLSDAMISESRRQVMGFHQLVKLADFGFAPVENRATSEKSMSSSFLAAMVRTSRLCRFVSLLIG
jgi:hypothetical protein